MGDTRNREAFEAWALSDSQWPGRRIDWREGAPFLLRDGDEYGARLRWEWSAWQAAVESERARYEGVVKAARRPDVIQPWERAMAETLRRTYEMHRSYPDNDPWITVAKRAIVAALEALDGAHE